MKYNLYFLIVLETKASEFKLFLEELKVLNYVHMSSYLWTFLFSTTTEYMVMLEERAAAKQDKAFRLSKACLKTKPGNVTNFVMIGQVIPPAKAARTLQTSYSPAYLANIPESGSNISQILKCCRYLVTFKRSASMQLNYLNIKGRPYSQIVYLRIRPTFIDTLPAFRPAEVA